MSRKTWIYIGVAVVLLYLLSRKGAPNGGPNADMGGPNFGALDPSTW